jgi:hypothetical protein
LGQLFRRSSSDNVRGQSLPLLAIQGDEYCTLLLGQGSIHGIATPNLVAGRNLGC